MPDEATRASQHILEYRDLAEAALRGAASPSPFLVTCVYTPTAHFVSEAATLLGPGGATGARAVLQHFLDDFVAETMLPRVMADAKAASQAILSQKNSFTPSAVTTQDSGGARVLQVCPWWA
jgi:hypothetical protein